MKTFFSILLLIACSCAYAQPVGFQRAYSSSYSKGFITIPANDKGYLTAGTTWAPNNKRSVYLIKSDSTGVPIWKKIYNGNFALYTDIPNMSLAETNDSGFVIAGTFNIFNGGTSDPYNDIFYFKIDANGNVLWHKRIHAISSSISHYANSIIQTNDGGYLVSGDGLYKTDSDGNLLWTKITNGIMLTASLPTDDGGYISTGAEFSGSIGNTDMILYKSDSIGNILWTKIYGTTAEDYASDIRLLDDGYIITGYSGAYALNDYKIQIIRIDSMGNILWNKAMGGAGSDISTFISSTVDKGFIIAGSTTSFGAGATDGYLIKTDSSGNITWSKAYGDANNQGFNAVLQTSERGYIATGVFDNKIYFVQSDSLGNTGCLENNAGTIVSTPAITQVNSVNITAGTLVNFNIISYNPILFYGGTSVSLCPSCNSPMPVNIIPNGSISFCQGDYVQLSVDTGFVNYLWSNNDDSSGIVVNTSGNYSVTITDSNGCTATATPVTITVHPLPAVPVITATGNTLTSSIAAGNQWYLNWNSIPGATAQNYTATQTGYYNVIVTDSNDCFSTSIAYYFSLGTEELSVKNEISIYPNPANGDFIFKTAEPGMLSIINMQGQIINRYQVIKGNNEIKMPDVSAGIYLGSFITTKEGKTTRVRIVYQP